MTSLHSIFHRAIFALALLGTGVAGPQALPAPAIDARNVCVAVQAERVAPSEPATALAQPPRAAVVAVRD